MSCFRRLASNFFIFWLALPFGVSAQIFTNVASEMGVTHTMNSSDGFGGGVSFFDFDNDGLDDLTLIREKDSLYIYRNTGSWYEPVNFTVNIGGKTRKPIRVDYNNDGNNDLFVTTKGGGSCRLFRNEGEMQLSDVTLESGLFGLSSNNYGASFADFDIY